MADREELLRLDPRTGRPLGDHGTHKDAVDFVLNSPQVMAPGEEGTFLRAWSEGDLDEWPEFYEWLAAASLRARAQDPLRAHGGGE